MKIQDLLMLTDENIDKELVGFFRDSEIDVFDIKESHLFGLSDREVLSLSVSQQRVVISQDSDFGTLVFKNEQPCYGIIYLRPGHGSPQVHIDSFQALFNANLDVQPPFILIAENYGSGVRIRLRNL